MQFTYFLTIYKKWIYEIRLNQLHKNKNEHIIGNKQLLHITKKQTKNKQNKQKIKYANHMPQSPKSLIIGGATFIRKYILT